MKLSSVLILGLLFTCTVLPLATAQDSDEVDEEVTVYDTTDGDSVQQDPVDSSQDDEQTDDYDIPDNGDDTMFGPSSDVSTAVYFPDFPDKNFPLDEEISALIVFKNSGAGRFNISHCVASLHSQFDMSYYVQNFSSRLLAISVDAHREMTVEFKFKPDRALEANQFRLTGYIVYNDSNSIVHVNSFVNTTISLVDLSAAPLIQFVSNWLVLIGFVAAIGAPFYYYRSSGKPARAPRAPRAASPESDGSSPQAIPSGFESAVYKQAEKSKAVKRNKDKGGKKDKKERKEKPGSASAASGSEKASE